MKQEGNWYTDAKSKSEIRGGFMSEHLQEALDSIAAALYIVPSGALPTEFGQPLNLQLAPPAADLQVTKTIAEPVSLTWVTKNVGYKDSELLSPPMGIGSPLGASTIETNISNLSAVALGLFGQLEGAVPVPIQVPVAVTVAWRAFDSLGNELLDGTDYASPTGRASPEVSFLFGLVSEEAFIPVTLQAAVTLNAAGVSASRTIELTVLVPALTVPTLVALFRRLDFNAKGSGKYVLVAVPPTALTPTLKEALEVLKTVRSLVFRVASIPRFFLFLTGLDRLIVSLSRKGQKIKFRQGEGIKKFYDIVYKRQKYTKTRLVTAQDIMSSMIFVGPPWHRVSCYNSPKYSDKEGQLDVGKTSSLVVLIPSLHDPTFSSSPGADPPPQTEPPGGAQIVKQTTHPNHGFGNELSSMKFKATTGAPIHAGGIELPTWLGASKATS
ncbi:MAG TPA: hypothetical protein VGQ11_11025 [Candidatus Acidoferrales bacterium]|nr:hypothetical protein [Candidatus Acidoferrales bacterium]